MMDGRRHSVDIPITKTLVALRRVRSLRDPSTSSMSKFPSLVENWETNSSNGINLGFENGHDEAGDYNRKERRLKGSHLCEKKEEHVSDHELHYGSRKSKSRLVSYETSCWVANIGHSSPRMIYDQQSSVAVPNGEMVCGNQSLTERYGCNHIDKGLDLLCVTPSSDCVEGVGSCNAPSEVSMQVEKTDHIASKRKCRYRKHTRSSRGAAGHVFSHVGSPCLSNSSALLESSTRTIALYRNGDVDVVDDGHGCKVSCCWSSTPRLRESNLLPDAEEQPLLSGVAGQNFLSEHRNYIENGFNLNSGSPRSLAQKFRPKSFDELVGQNAVARSLLGAISNGQITPFYLFHGPRGTGKTSAARIFAATLNCLSPDTEKPCGLCQECVLFFSGRSRDIREVDCVKINRMERIRSLTKSAKLPPVSSRFKVFIVDECHLLREEAWTTLLNNLQELSRHIVFILITPYLDRLPRSVVSRSQRYHFPKVKEADIAKKLEKMCVEEGLDFDQDALEFIGSKSTGSLRDAEMMLEQLCLLGKKITLSLVYELIGVVSDDELLDLLRLALSSDTSNTVKRARGLMRSINPMQLISQLANIIMDILAEKSQEGPSEAKRKLFGRLASEADMQQLSHALRVLTETEKQLRMSKNQTTWLTVALLQLSSVGSSFDVNDSRSCERTLHPQDNDFCSTSTGESLKHLVPCAYMTNGSCKVGMREEALEDIWSKCTGMCESSSVKNFLQKRGKLLSICLSQGIAVAELAFNHPKYVSKAEKSWKLIASALQSILGCNVEIRINLANFASSKKYAKVRKPSFNFFSCSRRSHSKSQSTTEYESEPTHNYDFTFKGVSTVDKSVETCSSDRGSQVSHISCDGKVAGKTIRNSDGNALSIGVTTHHKPLSVDLLKTNHLRVDDTEERINHGCEDLCALQAERQPGTFPSSASHQRKSNVSCTDQRFCHSIEEQNSLTLSSPSKRPSEIYFCASDPYISSRRPNDCINGSKDERRQREYSKLHCWRTVMFPFRKAWQLRHQSQNAHLMELVLPCAAAK